MLYLGLNMYHGLAVASGNAVSLGYFRYFSELEAPLQSHYVIEKEIVLTGDWYIEFVTSTTDVTNQVILGDDHTSTLYINTSDGHFTIWINGQSRIFNVPLGSNTNGELQVVRFDVVGNTVAATINGTTYPAQSVTNPNVTLPAGSKIGTSNSVAIYWQGYIADVDINGTKFKLGNASDMNIYSQNLWANPIFDSQWTDNGDGSYTLTGDGSFSMLYIELPENNKQYLLEFDYTSDGNLSARIDGSTNGTDPTSVPAGTNLSASVKCNANGAGNTQIGIARHIGGQVVNATVWNIRLRRVEQYVDNTIEYAEGTTFGADLATVPADSLGSAWTATDNKNYSVDGTNPSAQTVNFNTLLSLNTTYEIVARVTNFISGAFRINSNETNSPQLTSNGTIIWLHTPVVNEAFRLQALNANSEFDVELVSVKEVNGNAVTYVNIPDENMQQYRQDSDDWVGVENVITNGTFDSDFGWSKTGGAAISGGIGIIDGTGGQSLLFQASVEQGSYYRGKFEANVIVQAPTNELWNNDGGDIVSVVQGVNEIVDYQYPSNSEFLLFRSNGGHYTVDNFELYNVLKLATQATPPEDGGIFGTLTYFNTLEAI